MSKHPPPAPPEQQSHKGPGDPHIPQRDASRARAREGDAPTRGDNANIKQNTTHQGFQQDR